MRDDAPDVSTPTDVAATVAASMLHASSRIMRKLLAISFWVQEHLVSHTRHSQHCAETTPRTAGSVDKPSAEYTLNQYCCPRHITAKRGRQRENACTPDTYHADVPTMCRAPGKRSRRSLSAPAGRSVVNSDTTRDGTTRDNSYQECGWRGTGLCTASCTAACREPNLAQFYPPAHTRSAHVTAAGNGRRTAATSWAHLQGLMKL